MRRIVLTILCVLLLAGCVFAADDSVTGMAADVSVDESGECYVVVSADLTFTTAPKEVIFPLGADAESLTASGGEYHKETISGVVCAVFTSDAGFSGERTFTCRYTLPSCVTQTEQGDLFSLALPEKGWEYPAEQYKLEVTFPFPSESQPQWNSAYYGDVADNNMDITTQEKTVTATMRVQMKDHETLRMELLFPSGTFDLRHLPGKTATVDLIVFWLLFAAALVYWIFFLRSGILLPTPQTAAEMDGTAGELVCRLYGTAPDIAAMLAHWGNLGYLTVSRDLRGRITLRKRMEMGNERKSTERALFDAIFRRSDRCDVMSTRFRSAVKRHGESIRIGWCQRLYREKAGNPYLLRGIALLAGLFLGLMTFDALLSAGGIRWLWLPLLTVFYTALCLGVQTAVGAVLRRRRLPWLLLGALCALLVIIFGNNAGYLGLTLLGLLLQSFCALAVIFGGRRNKIGEETVRQVLGLRSFLRKMERDTLQRVAAENEQYFYEMLPYAETLGIGRKFAKRFSERRQEPCIWLTDARRKPNDAMDFYLLYEEIFAVVRADRLALLTNPTVQSAGRGDSRTARVARSRRPDPYRYEEDE